MTLEEKPREFETTDRFDVRRRLGSGGFGTVFEAYDHAHGSVVAVKVLRRLDPTTLYRFKREFRNLADVVHPNLVTLYELISEGASWFLTMELVRGVSFLEFVWGGVSGRAAADIDTAAATVDSDQDNDQRVRREPPPGDWPGLAPLGGVDFGRLRSALDQLASGIHTLHRHGILHCDIKPSNVLVTEDQRVVVLDFGLTTQLWTPEPTETIFGTPRYMSPEQAMGRPLSEASDWYSVGVMLREALTGVTPPVGLTLQAGPPLSVSPPDTPGIGLAEELDGLCRDLLRDEPADRLTGDVILARLGAAGARAPEFRVDRPAAEVSRFVGRTDHLRILEEAFEVVRTGRSVAVQVHGSSGMGKTALVRHFLDSLRASEPHAVILAGRCYEQESVPYKALDSVVDTLSQHLRHLPGAVVQSLLPRGTWALARVFPVLRRVEAIAEGRDGGPEAPSGLELRRRAFMALRELLGRLGDRRPLVLFIDDLQWGDLDSAGALRELLQAPDPPALLLIVSYRAEEAHTSPLLRRVLPLQELAGSATVVRDVEVGQLTPDEASDLALTLLEGDAHATGHAAAIARESGGSPLFIDQLASYDRWDLAQGKLDTMLQARVAQLPPRSRRLMEVVAVAGRPLDAGIAREAAGLGAEDLDAVALLRAGHFVRTRATEAEGRQEIEAYHDRIRETVVTGLSRDVLSGHHRRLAMALEASGRADFETLTEHFLGAGETARAARYTLDAAEQAAAALAFDRAARLYRLALELQPADAPGRHVWWAKLADALANAGRVVEAARAYLAAREGATPVERLDFERLAVEHFLMGGHQDEGLELLRSVLPAVGMGLPLTRRRALLSLLLKRPYIRLRGVRFRERPAHDISQEELERVDVCYSVVRGLGFIDPIGAIEFQARHLLRALKLGEPYRIVRALTFEATSASTRRRDRKRAERLLQTARELAERIQHPHAIGLCWSTTGLVDLMAGRWKRAWDALRRAEGIFRQHGVTHSYDIVVTHIHGLNALSYAGEFKEYFRWIPEFLEESQNRGDLYAETNLRMHHACRICFQHDDPDAARVEVQQAMASWSRGRVSMEHATELLRHAEFFLYEGKPDRAHDLVKRQWKSSFAPLLLFGIQIWVIAALNVRARIALGMAATAEGRARDRLLSAAERDARRLERQRTDWAGALGCLIRAGVASLSGRADRVVGLLVASEARFRDADMALHAAVAARQRGVILGGESGRALTSEADTWILGQGLKDPLRMSAMIAPGLGMPA